VERILLHWGSVGILVNGYELRVVRRLVNLVVRKLVHEVFVVEAPCEEQEEDMHMDGLERVVGKGDMGQKFEDAVLEEVVLGEDRLVRLEDKRLEEVDMGLLELLVGEVPIRVPGTFLEEVDAVPFETLVVLGVLVVLVDDLLRQQHNSNKADSEPFAPVPSKTAVSSEMSLIDEEIFLVS